jgi:hypothetical protein
LEVAAEETGALILDTEKWWRFAKLFINQ